jgi:hypothetical protein
VRSVVNHESVSRLQAMDIVAAACEMVVLLEALLDVGATKRFGKGQGMALRDGSRWGTG